MFGPADASLEVNMPTWNDHHMRGFGRGVMVYERVEASVECTTAWVGVNVGLKVAIVIECSDKKQA